MVRCLSFFITYLAFIAFIPLKARAQSTNYAPGEIIVKLKNSKQASAAGRGASTYVSRAKSQKGMSLKNAYSRMEVYHFSLKAGQRVEDAVAEALLDPEVEYAEPNYIFNKLTVGGVNQSFSLQEVQSMAAGSGGYLATGAPIQVPSTWSTITAHGVPVVAIVDTGLDITHSVFTSTNSLWVNAGEIAGNGIDDDYNGFIDDVNGWNFVSKSGNMIDDDGHGTHVAGIILGTTQDIYGTSLATAKIKVMPLKFLDSSGIGKTTDAISAIYYAVNNGASVINNSWGGSSYSSALHDAIIYAYNAGVVFVAAAGNNGRSNDSSPVYPANYDVPNVITIAATTDTDVLAYFSNYSQSKVHLASPGVFILSTLPGDGFGSMSGTSMATPFVSGLAALIKIEKPSMLAYQVKQIILGETDLVTDSSGNSVLANKVSTGGRMNVYNTVQAAKVASVYGSQPEYSYSNVNREMASSVAMSGCGLVSKMISERGSGDGGGAMPGPQGWTLFLFIGAFLLPIIIYQALRRRSPEQRRKHERFKVNTEVKVKVGDRELIGSVSSISLGGVQINTEALIEQGGIVSMVIRSPDGKEQIAVEGRVVWSESQKAYGVQFAETTQNIREHITNWTQSLSPLSIKK